MSDIFVIFRNGVARYYRITANGSLTLVATRKA